MSDRKFETDTTPHSDVVAGERSAMPIEAEFVGARGYHILSLWIFAALFCFLVMVGVIRDQGGLSLDREAHRSLTQQLPILATWTLIHGGLTFGAVTAFIRFRIAFRIWDYLGYATMLGAIVLLILEYIWVLRYQDTTLLRLFESVYYGFVGILLHVASLEQSRGLST